MTASFWITGLTRTGKTARLIDHFLAWAEEWYGDVAYPQNQETRFLMFAANGDNRIALYDRFMAATLGRYPVHSTTPAGFIQDEVLLFWPLLMEQLGLQSPFPLKLRPEMEQLLATRLWEAELEAGPLQIEGWRPPVLVRRCLDFLQLAAAAGIPLEDVPVLLQQGLGPTIASEEIWQAVGAALLRWRDWCLAQGVLTYGVMTELYWRYLLPHPLYRQRLVERFQGVLAEDVDEYPAIAADWLAEMLDLGLPLIATENPEGRIRLGLGADPDYGQRLARRCQQDVLPGYAVDSLAVEWADPVVGWVMDPRQIPEPPAVFQSIQTTSRGDLLRRTAEVITRAIHQRLVTPAEVAIISPGLDAIARYSLTEILGQRGIEVASLNDQRPPASSPLIRALLTLLTLVYPGLGRQVDRDAIAEMLVVLSQAPELAGTLSWFDNARIDPVRAELLADHCFVPDLEQPHLLEVNAFPRWDRLGYSATQAYDQIRQWIDTQQQQHRQRLLPNALALLDRAIQQFFWGGSHLPYDQLALLREMTETAQHFWTVEDRLQRGALPRRGESPERVGEFIDLLRSGAVTANPHPVRRPDQAPAAVTLATVYQYRAQRLCHRWQFWLDAGSPRWLSGVDALFGAPIFLQDWSGRPLTTADLEMGYEARLQRILKDLLGRATEQVYLCHSDLAISGQEQTGPLLSLVYATPPVETAGDALEEVPVQAGLTTAGAMVPSGEPVPGGEGA